MKVLVFGCGPSGLIAAQAALEFGAEVSIVSEQKLRSQIYGAQFLYERIPGVCSAQPDGTLHNIFLGEVETYRKKIYGDPTIKTTWDNKKGEEREPVWSLHHAYASLWDRFSHRIHEQRLDEKALRRGVMIDMFDLIISSIPLPAICRKRYAHNFNNYEVRILRQGDRQRLFPGDSNICIYNGIPEDTWFRFSHMFGQNGGFEMPSWNRADGSFVVKKPTGTDCDCWPNIVRVGRYGTWDYGVNTHHSWGIVMEAMSGRRDLPRLTSGDSESVPTVAGSRRMGD